MHNIMVIKPWICMHAWAMRLDARTRDAWGRHADCRIVLSFIQKTRGGGGGGGLATITHRGNRGSSCRCWSGRWPSPPGSRSRCAGSPPWAASAGGCCSPRPPASRRARTPPAPPPLKTRRRRRQGRRWRRTPQRLRYYQHPSIELQ